MGKAPSVDPNISLFLRHSFRALQLGLLSTIHVEELWLRDPTVSSATKLLGTVLGCMPNVKMLILLNCDTITVLRALTPRKNHGLFSCPNLRTLTVNDANNLNFSALVDFSKARKASGVPLKRVKVISSPLVFGGHFILLKRFIKFAECKTCSGGPKWPFKSVWKELELSNLSDLDMDSAASDDSEEI